MKNLNYMVLIVLVSALAVSACGGKKKDPLSTKKEQLKKLKVQQSKVNAEIRKLENEIATLSAETNKDKVIPVRVKTLSKREFVHYIQVQGVVDSDRSIRVSSEIGGQIKHLYVKNGQFVNAGATIAKVDDVLIRKGLAELEQTLDFVKINYEKQKQLWEKKVGTEIEFLSAKNQYESLLRKKESLEEQLAKTTIKAPISGVVDNIFLKEGEMSAPGVPILQIVNGGDVKLVADVPETYSASIKRGTTVTVHFPALNKTLQSTVINVGEVINPSDRSFKVEIALSNAEKLFKPNMLATVEIKDYEKKDAVVIPRNAIMKGEEQEFVFITQNNIAKKIAIKTGVNYQGETEVLSGLNGTEQLITVGFQDLADGQKVDIKS
jgi:RND family efflux transporter MFP subunit